MLGYQQDAKYRTYERDPQGTIIGLEGDQGEIPDDDKYVYDPYGELQSKTDTPTLDLTTQLPIPPDPSSDSETSPTGGYSADAQANPLRFQGFYYDSGVKLYDMQARSYRPNAGQFLTPDRFESSSSDFNLQADPLTQNRYALGGGNPIDNIEFDGHWPYYTGCAWGWFCGLRAAPQRRPVVRPVVPRPRPVIRRAREVRVAAQPKRSNPGWLKSSLNAVTNAASDTGRFVSKVGKGAAKGAAETGAGLANTVKCSMEVSCRMERLSRNPVDTARTAVQSEIDAFSHGSTGERVGRGIWSIGGLLLPAGKAGSAGAAASRGAAKAAGGEGAPAFARSAYGRLSAGDRADALKKSPTCAYCGKAPSTQVDHVNSLKQDWESGGWADDRAARTARANAPGNVVGACQACNAAKGARPIGTGPGTWWPPGWGQGVWWPFGGGP